MDPGEMVERRGQAIDLAVSGLNRVVDRELSDAALRLSDLGSRLRPPERRSAEVGAQHQEMLGDVYPRSLITSCTFGRRRLIRPAGCWRPIPLNAFLIAVSRWSVMKAGRTVKRAAEAPEGAKVTLRFADASRTGAAGPGWLRTKKITQLDQRHAILASNKTSSGQSHVSDQTKARRDRSGQPVLKRALSGMSCVGRSPLQHIVACQTCLPATPMRPEPLVRPFSDQPSSVALISVASRQDRGIIIRLGKRDRVARSSRETACPKAVRCAYRQADAFFLMASLIWLIDVSDRDGWPKNGTIMPSRSRWSISRHMI